MGMRKLADKIKLFVIDFDGTALGGYEPYERFPDNFSSFLDEISEQGVLWATCTTWHPYMQDKVFRVSNLRSRPVRAIGRTTLSCGLYKNGKLYMDAKWDNEMLVTKINFSLKYLDKIRNLLNSLRDKISLAEYFDYIFSVECEGTARKNAITKLRANRLIIEKTLLQFPDEKTILIFPHYMSKGLSVKKLQKELGINSKFTMVAGDGINDIDMLQKDICNFQVAPSNAAPFVKKLVRKNGGVVSALPYSDGVVQAAGTVFRRVGRKRNGTCPY